MGKVQLISTGEWCADWALVEFMSFDGSFEDKGYACAIIYRQDLAAFWFCWIWCFDAPIRRVPNQLSSPDTPADSDSLHTKSSVEGGIFWKRNLSRVKVYLLGVWKMYCRFEQYLYVRCGFTRAARGNFPSHIIGGTSGLEVGRRDPSFIVSTLGGFWCKHWRDRSNKSTKYGILFRPDSSVDNDFVLRWEIESPI